MNKQAWIFDPDYGQFALLRKFLLECGYQQAGIHQFMSLADITGLEPLPDIIFISSHHKAPHNLPALCFTIPVVLITDSGADITRQQLTAAGAQDYLVKHEITLPLFRKCLAHAIASKKMLLELERTRNDYMRVFHDHPLPMWVYKRDDLRFVEVNASAIHNYGYTHAEFLEMTIKDIRPGQEIPALLNTIARPCNSGFYDDNQWNHVKKNGEVIRVHIYSHNIDFSGMECKMVTAVNVSREYLLARKLAGSGFNLD